MIIWRYYVTAVTVGFTYAWVTLTHVASNQRDYSKGLTKGP